MDGQVFYVTEKSLRRHLYLDDSDGTISIANKDILIGISKLGYDTSKNRLTFNKGCFSPQWRFLIHTFLHSLSPKRSSWEQFSSNIATALVCFSKDEKYNFSN